MKILLADDSKFMRTILRGILEKSIQNTEYLEAGTGVETVKLAGEQNPDLILLDLIMPEKGGIDVLKEIGEAHRGKIIVVSAIGQEKVMEEALSLGAAAFIVKPFDEKKVVETVRKALGL